MNLYKPFHDNAVWFEEKFLPQTSGIFRKVLVCIGRKIPRYCWFRAKFNLNWTPCAINPFFHHLLGLAEFAAYEDMKGTLDKYIEILGNDNDASEES